MSANRKTLREELGVITQPGTLVEILDSSALFAANEAHSVASPIDQYFEHVARLRPLYRSHASSYTAELGKLIFLGYMSAVESFLRALIRCLVVIDEHARRTAEPLEIQYAAALHHRGDLLPEALLEKVSFTSRRVVCDTLRDVCGIDGLGNKMPDDLEKVFQAYDKICQLRHCCVHRFGRLGARNAQKLGMDEHSLLLEKSIRISVDQLEDITAILQRFVASLNHHVFEDVLRRSVECSPLLPRRTPQQYKSQWTLIWATDEARFKRYYEHFACTRPELRSPPELDMYQGFLRWAEAIRDEYRRAPGSQRNSNPP